jgi:UDP-N-acetylmuramoyl-tripeptide--D-alanyl-D-alanine ligase
VKTFYFYTIEYKALFMEIAQIYDLFVEVGRVSTDTRQIDGPCLFFALKGGNFDGNRYAKNALEKGATYAIVDDKSLANEPSCIYVEDALKCLQNLATHHRRQFHIPVLGITGSNGKTTTKELVSSVLESHYKTHFTKGNFNNHIGVPLTLLQIPEGVDIVVVEMGANHQGEIAALCEIAEPTHGLITNIGKAHLEGFGGIEGVKKGKSELYKHLGEHGGVAFINKEEKFLEDLAKVVDKKLFYKESETPTALEPDYEVKRLQESPFLKVGFLAEDGRLLEASSNLIGAYNFNNILTAVAVGKYFKVPAERIQSAIEGYVPSNNRSQLIDFNGHKVILDAYNANPTSMKAALTNFSNNSSHPNIAIIGDMLELGEESYAEHLAIAEFAKAQAFTHLVTVGKEFETVSKKLDISHFQDVQSLKNWFSEQDFEQSNLLLKASRGIGLERLLK